MGPNTKDEDIMRRPGVPAVLSLFAIIVLPLAASAQSTDIPFIPLKTDTPPVIDGILDDPVWGEAPSETGFKTWYPDYGIDMEENTVVWYAYDTENLYFAFRCYDSEPDKIKSSVAARDRIRADDWICLNIDTFNDNQSIYALYVNPSGIQMDSRATATSEDISIDVVWYSAARIDDEGYTIEVRIPFKSIRYNQREPVEMGIIFERRISRLSQSGTYPPLDPQQGPNFLTQTRTLLYNDIRHYRLVEVLPGVTYSSGWEQESGSLESTDDLSEVSLTGKLGITSRLVLDGTLNPDYSQVEADAGRVEFNRRFDLFYPEKRPFFLEGRENFIFGGGGDGDPLGSIVHTRMIINPDIGVKLTGKVGAKNTLAAIYAMDDLPPEWGEGENAQFAIMRYKRTLSKDSFVGGFLTARELDDGFNRVFGPDGLLRINQSSTIGFHALMSQNEAYGSSNIDYGHALGMNYRYFTRDWIVQARLHDLSDDFYTDTGFVTRTGITKLQTGVLRMFYPKSEVIQRIDPMIHYVTTFDHTVPSSYDLSDRMETYAAFDLRFILPRSTSLQAGYAYANEIFQNEKLRTGFFRLRASSQYTRHLFINASYQYGYKIRYMDPPYQGIGHSGGGAIVFQPSEHFNSTLSYTYTDFTNKADSEKEYDYQIIRSRNTYQINMYLFFRAIVEYTRADITGLPLGRELTTDFLVSFTYIPGTVIHLGYGSLYENTRWDDGLPGYVESDKYLEMRRGLFFKASYLWRF